MQVVVLHDLTVVQNFLSRCYKRRYTSVNFNILELLEKCDRRLFNKCSRDEYHPLYDLLPTYKETSFCIPQKSLKSKTKDSFFNRLIFRYNLAIHADMYKTM
jgi:hypothetical protein